MVGVVPANSSRLAGLPALSRIQLPGEPVGSVSPKVRFVFVRLVSRLTVTSPGRLTVLKSAVSPTPSAMKPFSQLVGSPQMLLERLVQVPLTARELSVPARSRQQVIGRRARASGRTGEKAVGVLMG